LTGRRFGLGFLNSRFTLTNVYDSGFTRPDNRFIPVGSDDLIEYLAQDAQTFGEQSSRITEVSRWLVRILEQEKSAFERIITRAYARINPDRETIDVLDTEPPGDSDFRLLNSKVQRRISSSSPTTR
jgi:hypothetical protein